MIWGRTDHFPSHIKKYDTILGFNEPNHSDQANMSPETVAHEWIKFQNFYPHNKLVSPAAAPPHTTEWFDKFFAKCKQLGCRVDYLGKLLDNII